MCNVGAQSGIKSNGVWMDGTPRRARAALITGAAGFIGSHLADLLLDEGFEVVGLDDLSNGQRRHLPWGRAGFQFEQFPLGDPVYDRRLDRLVGAADVVFHLAAPPLSAAHGPERLLRAGLQVAACCGRLARPLLFASSAAVYGRESAGPLPESAALQLDASAQHARAAAQLAIEQVVLELWRRQGVPAWVVRFFNVAGPRQKPADGVVAAFAHAARSDDQLLTIHGDGRATRSFLHVLDAVRAVYEVARCHDLAGRAVNVGHERETPVRELARRVLQLAGAEGPPVHADPADLLGDDATPIARRTADTALLREATGWSPRHALDDIILDSLGCATARPAPRTAQPTVSVPFS